MKTAPAPAWHARCPTSPITISAEVCREIREYERTSTTVANAYVLPLMDRYLARMQQGLRDLGADCPLLLMMSSGGICTVETARRFPVRLVESGPAGGAILARHVAARGGYDRAISFDMGGTTAKITLIDDFTPQQSRHFEVARTCALRQGQRLSGAHPGDRHGGDRRRRRFHRPRRRAEAHRGRAGQRRLRSRPRLLRAAAAPTPTVTDADVVLGRIDPAPVRRRQDRAAIPRAPNRPSPPASARTLDMALAEAARGIAEIVDETMASAARVHAVENGKDTGERTLIAFGGAAPLHAARLAQKLGMPRVVIPPDAGVGSAFGFLEAPVAYEVVRTRLLRLDALDQTEIDALFAEMRAEAEAVVRLAMPARRACRRPAPPTCATAARVTRSPCRWATARSIPTRCALAFDATYARLFGRIIPRLEIEALTWTLALSQPHDLPARADDAARCRRGPANRHAAASSNPASARRWMPRCSPAPICNPAPRCTARR